MAAFLVSALAIPGVLDETAFAFSIGDALVVIVHSGLYAQAHRSSVWRFVPLNLISAGCLVGAAFVSGAARYGFWIATLGLHYATSRLAAQVHESQASGYEVRAEHFVERLGSFSSSHLAIAIVVGFTAHEWAVGRRRRESKRWARRN